MSMLRLPRCLCSSEVIQGIENMTHEGGQRASSGRSNVKGINPACFTSFSVGYVLGKVDAQ